jgi:hypothetical protein
MRWIMHANVTVLNYLIYHFSRYDAVHNRFYHGSKLDFMNVSSGVNMAALVLQLSLQAASEYSIYAFI